MGTEEFNSMEALDQLIEEAEAPEEVKEETPVSEETLETKPEEAELGVEETPEVVETPAFTPDFTFKASGQTHEVPEMYRALMTSPESAEEVQKMLSKAYGIDDVLARRDEYRRELNELKPRAGQLEELYGHFNKLHANQDWESVLKLMEIPQEAIFQIALKQLEYDELSPQQKMVYDNERKYREQANQLELQNQRNEHQLQQIKHERINNEIQEVVSRPEYSDFAKTFDQHNGEGSFYREIINRGMTNYRLTGVEKSPAELVAEIHKAYGAFMQPQETQPAQPMQTQQVQQNTPVMPAQKPVIPATGNSNVAPVAKPINSMAALEKAFEDSLNA